MQRLRHCMISTGFTYAETLVSTLILGALLTGLWQVSSGSGDLNAMQMARLRCASAARAQLDCISTTGSSLDEAMINKLWPDVALNTAQSAGSGQWRGLTLVTVEAKAQFRGRDITRTYARYINLAPEAAP